MRICYFLIMAFLLSYPSLAEVPAVKPTPEPDPNRIETPEEMLGPWFADTQRRIRRSWFQKESHMNQHLSCSLKVNKDGSVSAHKVSISSGSKDVDEEALKAINSATLRPVPSGAIKFVRRKGLTVSFIDSPERKIIVKLTDK